jgi:hypothetical protein
MQKRKAGSEVPVSSRWVAGGLAVLFLFAGVPLALSASTTRAAVSPPVSKRAPAVNGMATEGAVVNADPGRWRGGRLSFTFQWRLCDPALVECADIPAATDSLYAIGAGDVGKVLRVLVTAVNRSGSASAVSPSTAPVAEAAAGVPANARPPAIVGNAEQDQVLVVDPGTWTAAGRLRFSYRWRSCDAQGGSCSFNGATRRTYRPRPADAGRTLRVLVSASGGPSTAAALTAPTAVVTPPPPQQLPPRNVSAPRISGTARAGQTITVEPGDWRGAQPMTFAFQWERCGHEGRDCASIDGAVRATFALESEDVGHRLRAVVVAENDAGRASAVSRATNVVDAAPAPPAQAPRNVTRPTIAGSAVQGATLTADSGRWDGTQPISIAFRWIRCDPSLTSCVALGGATSSTYRIGSSDVGRRLLVRVRARNAGGTSVAGSDATPVVQAAPPAPPPPPPAPPAKFVSVAQVSLPNRLVVDQISFTPGRITSTATPLTARFHISDTQGGRSVVGALVYALGVPFDRLSPEPEVATGADGWATITFQVLPTFSLRPGHYVVVFVRARKPGGDLLAGVSTRRLVSVRVG